MEAEKLGALCSAPYRHGERGTWRVDVGRERNKRTNPIYNAAGWEDEELAQDEKMTLGV